MEKYGRTPLWCHFHGCAYGLEWKGYPVQKGWTVLTTDRNIWLALQRKCPGHLDHVHCRGDAAKASAYYPPKMVEAICLGITRTWTSRDEVNGSSLSSDVSYYLLQSEEVQHSVSDPFGEMEEFGQIARDEEPSILALTRNRYPQEKPTGKRLEEIKTQMLRVHKAAGHPSMASLQRMLRARKAPQWAIELAGTIECPFCKEAKQPASPPVASLQETPGLFEIIGTDVFEFEFKDLKYKFMLIRDRASGLVMVELLKQFGGLDGETAYEPTTETVIRVFSRWLMHNPAPKWILTDSATYYTSQQMIDFAGQSGIGLLTTPAESHQMLGAEEGAIRILKGTVVRLLKEVEDMEVELAFVLAAHGHNQSIGPSGFSPFQWTRGSTAPLENLPVGINPKKAYGGMLRLKEKARVAFEMESAKDRLSKLSNTVPKPSLVYKPGQLVMLWRQKNKPGKQTGLWIGPVRMLLQEGQTLWLASGATLIRARTVQVRPCTRREEMVSTLEGTAVLKMPVTLENLLKNFTGRHFSDVTGDVPSEAQMQDNVQGAQVLQEPRLQMRADSWKLVQESGKRWLVRIHSMPRLALFTPSRTSTTPLREESLTGFRRTKLKGLHDGALEVAIEDDYKESEDPQRSLQDRWLGETWLEIKEDAPELPPAAKKKKTAPSGRKRKQGAVADESAVQSTVEEEVTPDPAEEDREENEGEGPLLSSGSKAELDPSIGQTIPDVPGISPLTTALRDRGPDAVDGALPSGSSSSFPRCSVDSCQLRGGHPGAHEDENGQKFHYTAHGGRTDEVDELVDSDSSEELVSDDVLYVRNKVHGKNDAGKPKDGLEGGSERHCSPPRGS